MLGHSLQGGCLEQRFRRKGEKKIHPASVESMMHSRFENTDKGILREAQTARLCFSYRALARKSRSHMKASARSVHVRTGLPEDPAEPVRALRLVAGGPSPAVPSRHVRSWLPGASQGSSPCLRELSQATRRWGWGTAPAASLCEAPLTCTAALGAAMTGGRQSTSSEHLKACGWHPGTDLALPVLTAHQ